MVKFFFKKAVFLLLVAFAFIIGSSHKKFITPANKTGFVQIDFKNRVKNLPLILDSIEYENPFFEKYRVTKLKYYISHMVLHNNQQSYTLPNFYHLIDAGNAASQSFKIAVPVGKYNSISFTLGVDSLKNISGAQTHALDPALGMFWTWNSGYVFFKLEGYSPASTLVNNKFEYHIGGFAWPHNALKTITLQMPDNKFLQVDENKKSNWVITADINKIWQAQNTIKITEMPTVNTPGAMAQKIADNYATLFFINEEQNN